MENTPKQPQFEPVDVSKLSEGMLLDRPLYVHLSANDRYIMLANAFMPLDPDVLVKFRRFGKVYSSVPAAAARFPLIERTARAVREQLLNDELAAFERNRGVRDATLWLVDYVFGVAETFDPIVLFVHHAFGVPDSKMLLHVSNLSVASFERDLKASALSGLIALWMGYTDVEFITQFVETVFCTEAHKSGSLPGAKKHDRRFEHLGGSDELADIVLVASFIERRKKGGALLPSNSRVARKLAKLFNLVPAETDEGRGAVRWGAVRRGANEQQSA